MDHHAFRPVRSAARLLATAAAILALHACMIHSGGASAQSDKSMITEEEIDSAHVFTAYEVIKKLRPQFLVSRGKLTLDPTEAPAMPNVYIDNMFYGDVTTLRNISIAAIESIRFYSSSEAEYKFGRGNAAGVIGIATKH